MVKRRRAKVELLSGSVWTVENTLAGIHRHVIPSTVGLGMGAGKKELLGMVHIPKCYYSSVQAACGDIVEKFGKVFLPRYKLKLIVTKRNTGLITLSLSNGPKLSMYTDNSIIGTLLGL
jgi:hypothetical protein